MSSRTVVSPLEAFRALDVSLDVLWVDYLSLGGSLSRARMLDVLCAAEPVGAYEHDVLAQTLNDYFVEREGDLRVRYRDTRLNG